MQIYPYDQKKMKFEKGVSVLHMIQSHSSIYLPLINNSYHIRIPES